MKTLIRFRRLAPLFLALPLSAQMMTMTSRDSARHVLDRLAWGPTSTQIDAVVKEGVKKWIDRQLGVESAKDPVLEPFEKQYQVMDVSLNEMFALYQDQTQKQQKIQAIQDTAERQKMQAQIRQEALQGNLSGRKGLGVLDNELASLTILRSIEADRQLADVLSEFWFNHFNVYQNKGNVRAFIADYIQNDIRPNVLGKFEDLVLATAKSPAMLFYLDNAQSVGEGTGSAAALARQRAQQAQLAGRGAAGRGAAGRGVVVRPGQLRANMDTTKNKVPPGRGQGLNENYGRELMELHTLGVDGGYTQTDVVNAARVLTGWTINRQGDGDFIFRPENHDRNEKVVMGMRFPAGGGEEEGVKMIKMLANHPSTMHHISAQLCARFVADVAPDGCIDDAVRAWQRTGGSIREVLRAIIYSQDFWSPQYVQSKMKTPYGFVVSAVRALGGSVDATPSAAQRIGQLGQPLFQHQTPNGYPEAQAEWVNSGALLARMNFAVQLASGRVPGIAVDLNNVVPLNSDSKALVENINQVLLGGTMSTNTRATILKEIAEERTPQAARALAIGLTIGGPEFQRR